MQHRRHGYERGHGERRSAGEKRDARELFLRATTHQRLRSGARNAVKTASSSRGYVENLFSTRCICKSENGTRGEGCAVQRGDINDAAATLREKGSRGKMRNDDTARRLASVPSLIDKTRGYKRTRLPSLSFLSSASVDAYTHRSSKPLSQAV